MNVLTVYAHSNPKSFCHAIVDQFTAGVHEAGHSIEVVDLYAIGFDPVHRPRDTPSWLTESVPDDLLDRMRVRDSVIEGAGGPLRRFSMKRLPGFAGA
jgi:NAD(P)H dehydrogenase (quinone)